MLVNVYGPAISTEDSAEERYAFKLQFYRVGCCRCSGVARVFSASTPALGHACPDLQLLLKGMLSSVK